LIDDIKNGHLPNIIAERGFKAEWKYNRPTLIKKMIIGAIIAVAVYSSISKKRK